VVSVETVVPVVQVIGGLSPGQVFTGGSWSSGTLVTTPPIVPATLSTADLRKQVNLMYTGAPGLTVGSTAHTFSDKTDAYLGFIMSIGRQPPSTPADLGAALANMVSNLKTKSPRTDTEQVVLRDLVLAMEVARRNAPLTPQEQAIQLQREVQLSLIDQIQAKMKADIAERDRIQALTGTGFGLSNFINAPLMMLHGRIAEAETAIAKLKQQLEKMPNPRAFSDAEALTRYLSMTLDQRLLRGVS
jgi:hypothetical protein